MTVYRVQDRKTPIGTILDAADTDGVLVETNDIVSHVILPLDDDLLDYLLERKTEFIAECRAIRARMNAGAVFSHEDARHIVDAQG